MSSDQFERTLQERFAQAEIHPSAALWDRIEADMTSATKGKRRTLWLWWSLAGLLFLSVGLAWVWTTESASETILQTASSPVMPKAVPENDPAIIPGSISQMYQFQDAANSPQADASGKSIENQTDPILKVRLSLSEKDMNSPTVQEDGRPATHPIHSSELVSAQPSPLSRWFVEGRIQQQLLSINPDLSRSFPPVVQQNIPHRKSAIWSTDLSLKTGYAVGLESPIRLGTENYLTADYAGIANRSSYSAPSSGQIATVLFPRVHYALALETGRMLGNRFRLSIGIEGEVGSGGLTNLGELDPPPGNGSTSGAMNDPVLIVEEREVTFSDPNSFTHITAGIPIRLSYLSGIGTGTLENSFGLSLNRSWTRISSQSQEESFAFQFNEGEALIQGPTLPGPVLQSKRWHSDVRVRSRYIITGQYPFSPFIGIELQAQLQPAFGGDASVKQRPFLFGIELGSRF